MPTASPSLLAPPPAVDGLVASLKRAWRQGTPPNTAGVLRDHPELLRHRSLTVDLAYEEYCLLEEAGRPPEPEEFCRQLPAFASQVREVIRGHRVFADHPELFAPAEVDWPEPGASYEGLVVERELGRGGFARVYLARDPATGNRPVALKLSQESSVEARTLGPIVHPHIVAIHWARRVEGLHAICMSFVGAATLADVIEGSFRGPAAGRPRSARTILGVTDSAAAPAAAPAARGASLLDGRESYPDAVATVAARLADALAYLHQSSVSHGDLKPSNIILGPSGHPYLIDFNLATGLDDSLFRCGGTVPYMAPERLRLLLGEREGTGAGAAAPTDVYSLGAVLFEALTGHLPFKPGTYLDPKDLARDMLRRQATAPPNATAYNPEVPGPLARLVAHCLLSDPRKRPSAQSLAQQLRRHLDRRARLKRALLTGSGLLGGVALAWQVAAAAPSAPDPHPQPEITAPSETSTVRAKPSTPEEFFQRGTEFLRGNDTAAAMKDFDDARRAKPDGQNTAYLAYCHARSGNHKAATTLYQEAIRDYAYAKAWAHSNRANSLIRCGSPDQFREAIGAATTALELAPGLRAAHLNRAYARFLLDLDPKTQVLKNPDECLNDLEAVMVKGPYTADLFYKAALVLVTAKPGNEEYCVRAVNWLREAVKLGRDPKLLAQDAVLRVHLAGRADFTEVTKQAPGERPARAANLHVIDPLDP
ncbi:protein kinase [Gemmata sp. G18]|uniref:non-specific serine/threonine protein kinase n=1 Tax=Gemmata palustris TaxID=2822762 RepID=A0ABS5BK26_9BACT|nr:serine/threonine-protein kinase [Gemmata palustris]MBP3954056.1 protein kinase [Gemmata palustris]